MKYTRCYFPMFVVTIFFLQILALAKEGRQSMDNEEILLYDFKNPNRTEDWRIVNDGVMGGLSQSEIVYSDSNTAIFRGTVSLENNGGFASTRTKPRSFDLHGYDGIQIRAKGDGKTYQFRLRTNDSFDGISYRYLFETEVNVWKTIKLPFSEFVPVFRGQILDEVEPVVPKDIRQIGFLISNKKAGKFQLEIEWIKAYKSNKL